MGIRQQGRKEAGEPPSFPQLLVFVLQAGGGEGGEGRGGGLLRGGATGLAGETGGGGGRGRVEY